MRIRLIKQLNSTQGKECNQHMGSSAFSATFPRRAYRVTVPLRHLPMTRPVCLLQQPHPRAWRVSIKSIMSSNVHPTSHFHPVNNVFIKRPPHPTDKGWFSGRYDPDKRVNVVPITQPISLHVLQFILQDWVIEINEQGGCS